MQWQWHKSHSHLSHPHHPYHNPHHKPLTDSCMKVESCIFAPVMIHIHTGSSLLQQESSSL